MTTSNATLRNRLGLALARWNGTVESGNNLADAAKELLDALDAQPSRQGKPWRVTFQHTQGALAGKIYKTSWRDISDATAQARTVIGATGRVGISKREEDGSYTPLTAQHLADWGYPEFAGYSLYGDPYYSREG